MSCFAVACSTSASSSKSPSFISLRSARALLGVPFRLHGRSADMGVDCVGLVALAAWRAGHEGEAPDRYGLRGGRVEQFENWLAAAGLRRVSSMVPGDIVLVQAGVRQFHVMVFTGEGFIHRSEEHTSELQSLMRISYAVFFLKK